MLPGTRLGEFEILHVIGQGGFGIVYFAKDSKDYRVSYSNLKLTVRRMTAAAQPVRGD